MAERRAFSITDAEVEELARYAMAIEAHYGRPMDIEWGKDGLDGKLYVLQARPETVKAREKIETLRRYRLKERSEVLATGRSIGQRIGSGPVRIVQERGRDGPRARRRRAGHRHDRSRLGAGDEARGGDRHQPRRAAPATPPSSRASWAYPRWSAAATRPRC